MANLNHVIKNWKETGSVDDLLTTLPDLSDITAVQTYLDTLDDTTRSELLKDLALLSVAMDDYVSAAKLEQNTIDQQLKQSTQNIKACLSYTQIQSPPDKR